MTTKSPAALLALLEGVDWDVPGLDGVDPQHISYIKSQLPALVNVALATSESQAREVHWAMDGDAQVGLFFRYPVQGVDVLSRLLAHANGPGGDWIMRDIRVVVDELPTISGHDESVTDAATALLMERRAIIDDASRASTVRLRHVAHIAFLVESEEWKQQAVAAAQALGADETQADIAQRVRLRPLGGSVYPGENRQRDIEAMFRRGQARTPYEEAALHAVYLGWRANGRKFAALLYRNDSQDVIVGSAITSSRWALRSDRSALAAVRSDLLARLSRAGTPSPLRLALSGRVLARAWVNGQCKEVRIRRSRLASNHPHAHTWEELLAMFESTSK